MPATAMTSIAPGFTLGSQSLQSPSAAVKPSMSLSSVGPELHASCWLPPEPLRPASKPTSSPPIPVAVLLLPVPAVVDCEAPPPPVLVKTPEVLLAEHDIMRAAPLMKPRRVNVVRIANPFSGEETGALHQSRSR